MVQFANVTVVLVVFESPIKMKRAPPPPLESPINQKQKHRHTNRSSIPQHRAKKKR
jgi:hypothetical protein